MQKFVSVIAGQPQAEPAAGHPLRLRRIWLPAKRGVVTAHVTTAHGLSLPQREAVRARLIEAGYGNVNIDEQVDASLLGGLVVRIGARLYDNSIKSRLQRLQFAMKGSRLDGHPSRRDIGNPQAPDCQLRHRGRCLRDRPGAERWATASPACSACRTSWPARWWNSPAPACAAWR